MAQTNRAQIRDEFKWDFSDIFASDQAWETAYAAAEQAIDGLPEVEGTLGESAEAMRRGLDRVFGCAEQVQRVYLYAMLRKNVDNGDPVTCTAGNCRARGDCKSGR